MCVIVLRRQEHRFNASKMTVHPGHGQFVLVILRGTQPFDDDTCTMAAAKFRQQPVAHRLEHAARGVEDQLDGAARADFVTAFYNPRSQRRTDLIEEAKRIYLAHRPADTPVIIGVVTILTLVFLVSNLLVDILYAALDPRIRYE